MSTSPPNLHTLAIIKLVRCSRLAWSTISATRRLTWARIGRNQPPSAVNSRSQPESKRRYLTAFTQLGHRPHRSEGVVRGGVEPPTFRFSGGRSYQLSYLTVPGLLPLPGLSGPDGI